MESNNSRRVPGDIEPDELDLDDTDLGDFAEDGSMDPNARSTVLRVIGIVAVVAVVGLLVPLPFAGRAASSIGNLFHAPLFGCLAFIAYWAWQKLVPPDTLTQPFPIQVLVAVSRAIFVAASATLVGAGMEAMQALTTRTASWHDATANMLGAIAGAILALVTIGWPWDDRYELPRAVWWRKGLGCFAAIILVGIASYDPMAILLDVTKVRREFPLLGSFESDSELWRWHFRDCWRERSARGVTAGKSSVRVQYDPSPNPAMTLIEMQSDWSDMKSLDLDVMVDPESADEMVHLMVKVTDASHNERHADSFHQVFKIPRGGTQTISIDRQSLVEGPDGRPLDLASIKYLDLMLDRPSVPTVLYFDHVRIVR